MNKLVLPVICFLCLFASKAISDEYDQFWSWFQKNQSQYYSMKNEDRSELNKLYEKLSVQLNKIDQNLTFEFGKLPDERMDFVISASGMEASFPQVIKLVKNAPKMENWKFTAFRQVKDVATTIEMGGAKVDPKAVLAQLYRDDGRTGIVLYMPGFKKTQHQLYEQLGFLLLDQTLGEYVVGTKVGFVEFKNKSGEIKNSLNLNEIAQYF